MLRKDFIFIVSVFIIFFAVNYPFLDRAITGFLTEAYGELKKVVWPSRAQTTRLTLTVLAITFAVAGLVAGLDYLFNRFGRKRKINDCKSDKKKPG